MASDFHLIWFALRHYPLFVLGFLLIGAAAVLDFHVKRTLEKTGHKVYWFVRDYKLSYAREYLVRRSTMAWSPWPVYLLLPCLIAGVVSLVASLFLMQK